MLPFDAVRLGRIPLLTRPAASGLAAGERIQMQSAPIALSAGALYDRHLREVYRYVARRIPRREEAEDVTAEVFQAAFRCLGKLRATDNPRVWLFGIARRKVVDYLRRNSRNPELLDCDQPMQLDDRADSAADPESVLRRAESRQTIRRIVDGLSEDHREALLLQYVEGLSIAEVAEVMGRSPAAANSLLQRARAAVFREGKSYFLEDSGMTECRMRNAEKDTAGSTHASRISEQETVTRHPSSVPPNDPSALEAQL